MDVRWVSVWAEKVWVKDGVLGLACMHACAYVHVHVSVHTYSLVRFLRRLWIGVLISCAEVLACEPTE